MVVVLQCVFTLRRSVGPTTITDGNETTWNHDLPIVECRVDVAAAKMGRDNLSAKSHDTENLRKLGFVSLSVARAWPIGRTLN